MKNKQAIFIKGVELKVGSTIMLKPYDCVDSLGIKKSNWQKFCKTPQTVAVLDGEYAFGMHDPECPSAPWRISYGAIDHIIEPLEVTT